MRRAVTYSVVLALAIGATAAWQIRHQMSEEQEGLLARAAVPQETARQTALASVPNGRIVDAEIEEENGRLIYAFDIRVGGDTYDVEVDAMTGELLQSELEDDDEDDDEDEDDDDET